MVRGRPSEHVLAGGWQPGDSDPPEASTLVLLLRRQNAQAQLAAALTDGALCVPVPQATHILCAWRFFWFFGFGVWGGGEEGLPVLGMLGVSHSAPCACCSRQLRGGAQARSGGARRGSAHAARSGRGGGSGAGDGPPSVQLAGDDLRRSAAAPPSVGMCVCVVGV
jgi:hypothetical protein